MVADIGQLLVQLPNSHQYEDVQKVHERIWRAFHKPSQRWLRIKVSNTDKQHFFLNQEAYWLTRLTADGHTHTPIICKQAPSLHLLVTEFLHGQTLNQIIRIHFGERVSNSQMLISSLYMQLLRCHQNSIIHADIKPNNMLVDDNGYVHLLDFANAGESGETLADRPYRGFSPSYALPSFQRGEGSYSPLLDWYAFLIVMRLILGGGLAQPVWSRVYAVSEQFFDWISQSGLSNTEQQQLKKICQQLDRGRFS